MMKFKKPRISIKIKIWVAIMTIVFAVIAFIWIFQVIFLEDYYVKIKKRDFLDMMKSIVFQIDQNGILDSQDVLMQKVVENRLCIHIINDNNLALKIEGLPYDCYVHKNFQTESKVINDAHNSNGKYVIKNVSDKERKQDYFVGYVKSHIIDGTGYIVIVTQTLAPVREAAMVVRNQLRVISVLLIIAATVIAFLVARSLTKPILKITDAARKIADGSLNVNVNVRSNDELGDLGKNFNYMSKEISKVNNLQRELIANISHDIRTPLTMIKGYAETIKDITGENQEMRNQQLEIIIDESNRLNTLVNNVMDLSLLQAGRLPLHTSPFDITDKCRDILSRYQLLEQTSGFEFILEAEKNITVFADEVRIEQVLYNLINNAVNHIGEIKKIVVRVLKENGEAKVEVIDTGTGIPKEDLPLIWDRYYKPYKKTQQKALGTGLGLSIVKAILVNHHSRFGVMSTLGKGSTFWFTLPIAVSKGSQ